MKNYKDFVTEAGRCWKDYKPVPGKTPFTPGSCVKEEESIDESSDSGLAAKAEKSGVSIGTLRTVYKRGVAAWNSGHRPGTTPQQWGMARVNSYITKGKGTYGGADKDLHEASEVPKDKESGLPKKYVAGLSTSTAKARAAHWNKMDKKSDRDPSAYEPAPGDAGAKTKESKHTKKYRDMFGEAAVDAKGLKSSTGGLTQKGRDYYNRKDGGNLKAPVTTPPSKLTPGSKAANRRKSFCARMGGVEGPMKKPNGEPSRKALALRKWNC